MQMTNRFPFWITRKASIDGVNEVAVQLFSKFEIAALDKLTENVSSEYDRETDRYNLLIWAVKLRLTEKRIKMQSRALQGIFDGAIHFVDFYPDGTPRFAIEQGAKV